MSSTSTSSPTATASVGQLRAKDKKFLQAINELVEDQFAQHKRRLLDEADRLQLSTQGAAVRQFVRFILDAPPLSLEYKDLPQRKRIVCNIPPHERCLACVASPSKQCSRRRTDQSSFCGTHRQKQPNGVVREDETEALPDDTLIPVSIWVQEIRGICYHIDQHGNVYNSRDVASSIQNPRICNKYTFSPETGFELVGLQPRSTTTTKKTSASDSEPAAVAKRRRRK